MTIRVQSLTLNLKVRYMTSVTLTGTLDVKRVAAPCVYVYWDLSKNRDDSIFKSKSPEMLVLALLDRK